jgi:hypothetical protein
VRLARRSLALRPAHPRGHQVVTAIRRLQPFRYLHDCSDCFRRERNRRVGLAPTGKRRLFTAHADSGHSRTCDRTGRLIGSGRTGRPSRSIPQHLEPSQLRIAHAPHRHRHRPPQPAKRPGRLTSLSWTVLTFARCAYIVRPAEGQGWRIRSMLKIDHQDRV